MIRIKETDLPNSIVVSQQDRNLGMAGNNNFITRVFSFPKIFKGLDLTGNDYVVLLQVQPVNNTEDAFYVPLVKDVSEDSVLYILKVGRELTKDPGELITNIKILSADNDADLVGYTFLFKFFIEENIDANKSIEKIPPNILEQYVASAATEAKIAQEAADSVNDVVITDGDGTRYLSDDGTYKEVSSSDGDAGDYLDLLNKPSINGVVLKGNNTSEDLQLQPVMVKSESYLEFPSIGKENTMYLDIGQNKIYRWDEANLKYYVIGSDYNDVKLINGGNSYGE